MPLISHDLDLERLCGVNELIANVNYADLPTFRNEIEISFSPGTFYVRKPSDATKMDRFEDFLISLNAKDPNRKVWITMQFKAVDRTLY